MEEVFCLKEKTANEGKPLPSVNIGMVGHVDHGKTTLNLALTGKWNDTHSEEMKRGITIRLGYADATFYKCPKCSEPECYMTAEKCLRCGSDCGVLRTISIVDAPGHETLMTTVLSGSAIMDGAILVISAHEQCPQPQTREHLTTLEIIGIKNIIIVQNKVDIVSEEEAGKNYEQIKKFVKGTIAENAPIIPVSAQHRVNIDALIEAIEKYIPEPKRDLEKPPLFYTARSFDINKPGSKIENLSGGIIGGSLVQGRLKVGDEIEINPGIKVKENFRLLKTKITGLKQMGRNLDGAVPGGLLGVMTELDPSLTKSDRLAGNIAGLPGKVPVPAAEVVMTANIMERVVGTKEELKVEPIKSGDLIMVAAGVQRTVGQVVSTAGGKVKTKVRIPLCVERKDRVAISRQVSGRWRLIGWGEIV